MTVVGFAALWVAQTLLLLAAGEPWKVWPLRHRSEKPLVRWGMKAAVQAVLLSLLFGFPAVIGENPLEYNRARLHPVNWLLLGGILVSATLACCPMFLLNIALGWVKVAPHHSTAKTVQKVARSLLTPLPLAFVEEALFRGVILDTLLRAMPSPEGMVVGVVLSAAVFASVHFFRPQKRVLLPAVGLFGLGVILGTAYIVGGYSYWLPVGIHAGGVLFIQVCRPFVEYRGPAWLIGYSSYPICGLFGLASMATYVTLLALWLPPV
jgi:hypothetical protein